MLLRSLSDEVMSNVKMGLLSSFPPVGRSSRSVARPFLAGLTSILDISDDSKMIFTKRAALGSLIIRSFVD